MSNKDAYSKIFNVLNYLKFLMSPSRVKDSSRGMNAEMGTAVFYYPVAWETLIARRPYPVLPEHLRG